jgi:hypothetical protein
MASSTVDSDPSVGIGAVGDADEGDADEGDADEGDADEGDADEGDADEGDADVGRRDGAAVGTGEGLVVGTAEGLVVGWIVGAALEGCAEAGSASTTAAIEPKPALERGEGASDSGRKLALSGAIDTGASEIACGACDGVAETGAVDDGAEVFRMANPPKDCSAPRSIWPARSAAAVAGIDTVTTTLPAVTLTLTKDTSRPNLAAISPAMRATAASSKSDTEPARVKVTVPSRTGAGVGGSDGAGVLGTGVAGVAVLGTGVTGAGVMGALVAATGADVVGRGVMGAGAWLGTWDSQAEARYGPTYESENGRRAVVQGVVGVSACAPHLKNASCACAAHVRSSEHACAKPLRAAHEACES